MGGKEGGRQGGIESEKEGEREGWKPSRYGPKENGNVRRQERRKTGILVVSGEDQSVLMMEGWKRLGGKIISILLKQLVTKEGCQLYYILHLHNSMVMTSFHYTYESR